MKVEGAKIGSEEVEVDCSVWTMAREWILCSNLGYEVV